MAAALVKCNDLPSNVTTENFYASVDETKQTSNRVLIQM
jgi:hypothetical protein